MKFMQLKYALEIERIGSIKKAAQSLNVNQPYLSRVVHSLEDEIGLKIFERTSKGVSPTLKGKIFLDKSRKVIGELDELESLFVHSPATVKFQVALPRASYIAKAYIDLLAHINFDNTSIDFNYFETSSDEVIKLIVESQFDIGIIRYSALQERKYDEILIEKNLKRQKLCTFEAQVLMSKNHPLATQEHIYLEDLNRHTQLYHGDNDFFLSPNYQVDGHSNSECHKRILIYERASQLEMLSKVTDTFMWVSPMPQSILDRYGLVTKNCDNICVKYVDVLIYRDNYYLSRYDHLFIELINKNINMI